MRTLLGLLLGIGALLIMLWVTVMVIGLLGRLVMWLTRPGWSRFVDAWERTFIQGGKGVLKADYVRPTRAISDQEVLAMNAVYKAWRRAGRPKPITDWLERWAEVAGR